jgi:enhancer of mRNA-decapping protein 4
MEVAIPAFTFSTPQGGLPHPQCTPIAFYNSDAPYGSGRLIAVSDAFICYAIKDGHIRGINRQSVQRTLLKGHKKPVIDMAFARRSTCILASLGGDGSFFMWTIGENPADKSLTSVPLLSVTNVHLQRVVWHPTKPHTIAVVAPNGEVALINTQSLIQKLGGKPGGPAPTLAATNGVDDLKPEWKLTAASNQCLDLSFSQDGKYLVTAGADGWARVWEVESRQAMGRWQPYGGEPVSRALFLHRTKGSSTGEKVFVVTGGKQASEVKLFRAWTTLSPINTQTLTFVPPPPDRDVGKGGRAFHLEADESGEFLLLADAVRPLLYVAHVVLGPSTAKVDRVTPFQLKHPVLSLLSLPGVAMDAHEGQADKTGASEVQLFCVQTQAIQIYHLRPEDCLPSSSTSTSTIPAFFPPSTTPTAAAAAPPPPPATPARSPHQSPSPPPPAQQPAILQMLLQASQAAGSGGSSSSSSTTTTPGLISPQSLTAGATANGRRTAAAGRGGGVDEAASTQSVAASLTEAKQTGGAHTTEEKGQPISGTSSSTSSTSSGLGSRTNSAQGGGAASGQASRDAASRMGPVAVVSPSEPAPSIPPPPPPPPHPTSSVPQQAAAASAGAGVSLAAATAATAATVNTEVVLAGLRDMEQRLGQLLTQNTKKAVNEAMSGMDKKIEKAIKSAVATQLGDVPAQVKEAALAGLGDAVKEPLSSSLKQCFQESLLPAMQNTTQRMFAQINDSINKNLPGAVTAAMAASGGGGGGGGGASAAAAAAAAVTEVKGEVGQVRRELTSVANAVAALSAQLAALGSRLESGGGDVLDFGGGLGGGAWRGKTAPAAAPAPAAPVIAAARKEELLRDLRAGRIDEVFVNVLSSQNLDLLLWLCSESPKDDIFDSDPPLLSQPTMFCLLQQLTFHLGQHTAQKLEWMQELVLAINPSDSVVGSYLGEVCPDLIKNFNEAAPEVVALGHPQLVKDFKMVQKAIQNLARGT